MNLFVLEFLAGSHEEDLVFVSGPAEDIIPHEGGVPYMKTPK